jgi:2-polyprenyl-3-methyl-5-hydroxy-6-metoxy-1,4-benzoquinol methylase
VWGDQNIWKPGEIRHWLQHPLVQERINSKVVEGVGGDRFSSFLKRHLNGKLPVERALTLGCGQGELERGLSKYQFARIHEGVDLTAHAIRLAEEAAQAKGLQHIQYRVADLNTIALTPDAYDVIFGVSSIHHVENLEHLFSQVRQALRPTGYLFLDEYIGPAKFQWTDDQLHLMNEQLALMPAHLRRDVTQPGKLKDKVARKTLRFMNESDPSEAVRSSDIVPTLSQYFRIVEFKGYGGSLLHDLLEDIAGNFAEANPGSLDYLTRLFQLEDTLIESGRLSHDFAVIVATPL